MVHNAINHPLASERKVLDSSMQYIVKFADLSVMHAAGLYLPAIFKKGIDNFYKCNLAEQGKRVPI